MRAVICKSFGPPENLVVEEVDDPIPGPGQLLVEVRAAGVTFPDALMVEDKYQYHPVPPYTPGGEVAGVVRALGEGVEGFAVGDRVSAGSAEGGFAELSAVGAGSARVVSDAMSFEEAVGISYSFGTALYGLRDRGNLQAGETLLVLGAAGAIGLAAVELGKQIGARVIAAASTDEKVSLCRERGADEGINYSTENLKERVKELTGGKGANVVYDPVGGDYAEAALRATAWEGRFLVIGFTAGIPRLPLNLPLLKGCQVVGVFFGAMMGREPKRAKRINDDLMALCDEGKISSYVTARYPLERAGQALRDLTERRAMGKIVVVP
ncbi:MAG: NADPH:quinone oxidoreductase family protein [Myxococcales bacterium]|nr:NADPH:quinone oxidoreductase family protein [Myxococcales bacterium]